MTPELRKCPILLCGGEAELATDVSRVREMYLIRCTKCGAFTDRAHTTHLAKLVKNWNGPAPLVTTKVTRSEHILLDANTTAQLQGKGYVVYGVKEEQE